MQPAWSISSAVAILSVGWRQIPKGPCTTGRSEFSRLLDEGLQEGFAGTPITVANLRRSFAVALAGLLHPATLTKPGAGGLEPLHRPAP